MPLTKDNSADPIHEMDLILVQVDHKPGFFARVEDITSDSKPGWWQVRLLPLGMDNLEYNTLVWILDDSQIRGSEYTMSGISMKIEKVPAYHKPEPDKPVRKKQRTSNKVVNLADMRK